MAGPCTVRSDYGKKAEGLASVDIMTPECQAQPDDFSGEDIHLLMATTLRHSRACYILSVSYLLDAVSLLISLVSAWKNGGASGNRTRTAGELLRAGLSGWLSAHTGFLNSFVGMALWCRVSDFPILFEGLL